MSTQVPNIGEAVLPDLGRHGRTTKDQSTSDGAAARFEAFLDAVTPRADRPARRDSPIPSNFERSERPTVDRPRPETLRRRPNRDADARSDRIADRNNTERRDVTDVDEGEDGIRPDEVEARSIEDDRSPDDATDDAPAEDGDRSAEAETDNDASGDENSSDQSAEQTDGAEADGGGEIAADELADELPVTLAVAPDDFAADDDAELATAEGETAKVEIQAGLTDEADEPVSYTHLTLPTKA